MSRQPDPLRKPALVEQILDHLLDKPLASMSFRTLAKALDVSTYTLVYQFGTREQLLRDIVAAISSRSALIEDRLQSNPGTREIYFEGLALSWEWMLEPRNRQLQRLEFEAAMLESLEPDGFTSTRHLFSMWQRMGENALESFGLAPEDARLEARVLVATFHGIQFDLIVNRDEAAATAAFHRAVESHRARLEKLSPTLA